MLDPNFGQSIKISHEARLTPLLTLSKTRGQGHLHQKVLVVLSFYFGIATMPACYSHYHYSSSMRTWSLQSPRFFGSVAVVQGKRECQKSPGDCDRRQHLVHASFRAPRTHHLAKSNQRQLQVELQQVGDRNSKYPPCRLKPRQSAVQQCFHGEGVQMPKAGWSTEISTTHGVEV